ncbi:nuclear transport factor 2 family protein [Pedobacter glucosidilyticus]|uniref:nuclear transport factor 2 family protein n=1 Tax=Pedobacter glucosidilyticus TaxID=1122941 RepID=UPI0026F14E3E|nr:nuclear transport factor 2 family protein [Pedobacter glucosidilyticus]
MRKLPLLILIFMTTMTSAFAQTKAEKEVSIAVEKLRDAMVSGNRADLESIASTHLSYGHSGGKIEDKAAFVESIAGGSSDFVKIDLADQTIQVTGNTAIVRHKLSADTNDGGKPGHVNLHILLVFVKNSGNWELLARQAVKIL